MRTCNYITTVPCCALLTKQDYAYGAGTGAVVTVLITGVLFCFLIYLYSRCIERRRLGFQTSKPECLFGKLWSQILATMIQRIKLNVVLTTRDS